MSISIAKAADVESAIVAVAAKNVRRIIGIFLQLIEYRLGMAKDVGEVFSKLQRGYSAYAI